MFSLLFIIAIAGCAVAAPILMRRADAFTPITVDAATASTLRGAASATRWRVVATLAAAVAVIVAGLIANDAAPKAYGLPLMLAPGLAASVGLLVFAIFPAVRIEGQTRRRAASLEPRRPWSYGPRRAYLLPLGAGVAVIVFAVLAGLASSQSDDGHYRSIGFAAGDYSTSASPYPGWYYGGWLIAMTAVLLATTLLALWRIAAAPAPGIGELRSPDAALRLLSAGVVMKLSSGALLTYAGGVLVFAGRATANAAGNLPGEGFSLLDLAVALGVIQLVAGVLAVLAGVALLALAAADAGRPILVSATGAAITRGDRP